MTTHRTYILIILTVVTFGCVTTSKMSAPNPIAENNKDVLILSNLIRDHFQRTNGRDTDLSELVQNDSLERISNNFEKVVTQYDGHITVRYKFSTSRDSKIELTNREREMLHTANFIAKDLTEEYDGEIHFYYGERAFYRRKIIVNKHSD